MSCLIEWKWSDGSENVKSKKQQPSNTIILKDNREKEKQITSNRDLITTTFKNPFMANNNYIDDLDTHNKFLIPQNSNF